MYLDTYAIICGISVISVHAIAEAKRPAGFLKMLTVRFADHPVFLTVRFAAITLTSIIYTLS